MESTTTLINRINKHTKDILLVSLLFLLINISNDYHKTSMLTNFSNTFLIATLLMVLCLKIFIFNINLPLVKDILDVNDILIWIMGTINIKLCFGVMFSITNILSPTFRVAYIPIYLTIGVHLCAVIKELITMVNTIEISNTEKIDNQTI